MEKRRKGEIVPTREEKLRGLPLARHWPLAPRSALILLLPHLYSDSTMNETIPAINRLGAARRGAARRFHERTLDSELSRFPFQFHDISDPLNPVKKIRDREFSWENGKNEKKIDRLSIPQSNFNFISSNFFFPRKTIDIFAWLFSRTSRSSSFDLEKSTMDR